ncbi:MAG: 4-hydroxyacetophenone monooxygenase, partial [Ktedonobacteraceae bacterium]|nr:4-hydroxyacetophenone monooxygenase [Ktedonobacteraceae bacterium]
CLRTIDRRKLSAVEVRPEFQEAFNKEMQQRLRGTVWSSGCSSWYLNANGRNTTIWPGFTFEFWRRTRRFDQHHYDLIPARAGTAD